MRKLQPIHGPFFWVRPMLVEVLMGIGLAALYWWEVDQHGLIAHQVAELRSVAQCGAGYAAFWSSSYAAFAAHAILITLMLAATLVDLDELMIPDAITVYGALLGIALGHGISDGFVAARRRARPDPLAACVDAWQFRQVS